MSGASHTTSLTQLVQRRYRVERLLGEGRLGQVYLAALEGEEGFLKAVALRVVAVSALAEVRGEARALAGVRDHALLRVEAPVRLSGVWASVMELADGLPLSGLAPLPRGVALEVVREVARAVDAVQGALSVTVAQEGLAPSRVLLGATGQVRLVGLGRYLDGAPGDDQVGLSALLADLCGEEALLEGCATPREVERRCAADRAERGGAGLRAWLEGRTLEVPAVAGGEALVGAVLEEEVARPSRRRWGWALLALSLGVGWGLWGGDPPQEPAVVSARRLFSYSALHAPRSADLSRDGSSVLWTDRRALWSRPLAGGAPTPWVEGGGFDLSAVASCPDGSALVAGVGGDAEQLFRVRQGEAPVSLGRWPLEQLALSPDGRRAALVLADSLSILELETGEERRLISWGSNAYAGAISWTPAGDALAFARAWLEGGDVRTVIDRVDAETGAVRTLLEGADLRGMSGRLTMVAWDDAGELLFFRFPYDRAVVELRAVDPVSGRERLLHTLLVREVEDLRVAGARALVLTSELHRDVWIAALGEGEVGPLRRLTEDEWIDFPTGWDREGRVIFVSDRYGTYDLFAKGPDEVEATLLVGTAARELEGLVAAGGLVYARREDDGWWWIRRDGAGERHLLRLSPPDDGVWELDCGLEVCAVQQSDGVKAVWRLADPRTGGLGEVLHSRAANPWPDAALSPDGQTLAVVSHSAGIELVDDAGVREVIPDPEVSFREVAWLPDGRSLLAAGYLGEATFGLWWVDRDGAVRTRVESDARLLRPRVSPDGRYVAVEGQLEERALWVLDLSEPE